MCSSKIRYNMRARDRERGRKRGERETAIKASVSEKKKCNIHQVNLFISIAYVKFFK